MKIFPIRPMSTLDRFNNLIQVIENPEFVYNIQKNHLSYELKMKTNSNGKYCFNKLYNNFCNKISEATTKIRRTYNEKISRN